MTAFSVEASYAKVNTAARQAGVWYLLFSIVAIFYEFILPSAVVAGDAAATAQKIISSEQIYRLGILSGFITHILFIIVVVSLYRLFRDVDQKQAVFMLLMVSIGVTVAFANLINKLAPLVLLGGADYFTVFTKPQLDALAMAFLRLHSSGLSMTMAFWGLWLFPFGFLVIKSGYFPKILGVLLILAGIAYLTVSWTSIVAPAYRPVVTRIMTPLYFGELPIIFWLIKGATKPRLQPWESNQHP